MTNSIQEKLSTLRGESRFVIKDTLFSVTLTYIAGESYVYHDTDTVCDEYGNCINLPTKVAWVKIPNEQLENIKWLWKGKVMQLSKTGEYFVLIKEAEFDKQLRRIQF